MRSTRTLCLAAGAIAIALALIGASAASAASTQLCKTHASLTCPEGSATTSVSMTNEGQGVGRLLSSLATVLCLTMSGSGTPLALKSPQEIHISGLSFTACGTNAAHDNCVVTVLQQPLANLNKTGLDLGTLTGTNGEVLVECEDIDVLGTDIECTYDATNLQLSVGAQHLTANETPVKEIGSDFLCPENPTLDGLLTTGATSATALCKAHTKSCAEKDQAKSLDMTTTKAPVLYNTVANVECESSLAAATVLSPAEPQKLDVTALTWKECHTQGAAYNCTVSTSALPTIDLDATALNLGSAETSGLEIEVDCLILDLIELDCTFDSDVTLQGEGALHKESSGHGRFSAAETELELAEGGEHCPDEVKWDASYEVSEHLYVVPPSSGGSYILA